MSEAHIVLRDSDRPLLTTLDLVAARADRILFIHVGDGRIGLIRAGTIELGWLLRPFKGRIEREARERLGGIPGSG